MEHDVYLCTWKQSADGFVLWVKAKPRLRGEGRTYTEAEENLITAIQDAGGAMQAVLEFDPPLPVSNLEVKYKTPELYLIGGDDRFATNSPRWRFSESATELDERLRWHDAFYELPVCRKCKCASSPRSEEPLKLRYVRSEYDGAFGFVGSDGGVVHQIVSEEFLSLLTAEERSRLQFRPIVRKGRKKFYELVGPNGPPLVAVSGLELKGWRCSQCNHRTWGYWIAGMAIHSFVAKSDLPMPVAGVFTVGVAPEIQLAVTASRWKELMGQKGSRGFTSRSLGVASDNEIIRCPELPTSEEQVVSSRA